MTNLLKSIPSNAKNIKNKIADMAKKATIIASLTAALSACGESDKKQAPQVSDGIKTEQTINTKQDTLTSTEKIQSSSTEKSEDVELDFNLDGVEEEALKQLKEEEEAQKNMQERQRLGFESEKGYNLSLEMVERAENTFQEVKSINYQRNDELKILLKDIVKRYKEQKGYLQQPYSPTAKEVIKRLEAEK